MVTQMSLDRSCVEQVPPGANIVTTTGATHEVAVTPLPYDVECCDIAVNRPQRCACFVGNRSEAASDALVLFDFFRVLAANLQMRPSHDQCRNVGDHTSENESGLTLVCLPGRSLFEFKTSNSVSPTNEEALPRPTSARVTLWCQASGCQLR